MAQIQRGGGGGETKRWRDTKNSITGLALTLTFIQQGNTPSLSQLLLTAATGEVCPTSSLLKFDSAKDEAHIYLTPAWPDHISSHFDYIINNVLTGCSRIWVKTKYEDDCPQYRWSSEVNYYKFHVFGKPQNIIINNNIII